MKATVNTALSVLLMLFLTVSSATAMTCLRVSDNEQFKLKFYKDVIKTNSWAANELWLRGDNKTYIAKILDQNSTHLFAAYFNWKYNTPTVETFHFDRIKRRINLFSSKLSEGGQTIKLDEFLCVK